MQTETVLNDRVTHGLRAQFSPERVSTILSQAETMALHAEYQNGVGAQMPTPEPYELLEGGWIDKATEFLGFGRWAIGRPKSLQSAEPLKDRFARHIGRSTSKPSVTTRVEPVAQTVVDLFERHLPRSLRNPNSTWENAIEYRSILIIGEQGSGKTTLARSFAYALTERYGSGVFSGLEVGGIASLLEYGTRVHSKVWFLVGEDLTMSKVPKPTLAGFFQVRNLIMQRTGLNRGLVVTGFNSHTLFGIERNLRTAFHMLILKSVPVNPYDRSLLKRYFAPELLDWFEQHGGVEDALVWDRYHPHGVLAKVPLPPANTLTELVAKPNGSNFQWWILLWKIALLGALTAPLWLFGVFH